jgi:P2 family phage contractile tail tube protein
MQIQKIFNANVYVDATNNLLGKAGEVTLPEVVTTTDDHLALGMISKVQLPTGLEPLSMKLKWNGYYGDRVTLGANPFVTHKIQVRASVEVFDAGGRIAEQPFVALATGRWMKLPMGVLGPQKSPEFEDEIACTYFKASLNGVELVEIDTLQNVWRVGGKDLLVAYRKNLGL